MRPLRPPFAPEPLASDRRYRWAVTIAGGALVLVYASTMLLWHHTGNGLWFLAFVGYSAAHAVLARRYERAARRRLAATRGPVAPRA